MITSYQFSERVNVQTILWSIGGALIAIIRSLAAIVGRAFAILSHFLPTLLLAMGLTAVCVAGAAIIAMIPPTFWLGLAITGALAYVGYPRAKVVNHG